MKTSKKILLVAVSLIVTSLISAGIALGCSVFFGLAFWHVFWFGNAAQVGGTLLWDKFYESRKIIEAVQAYANVPYKKYLLELNCGHCGHKNEVEVDLVETEFRCTNCQKFNGIHVTFMAAAITEPISESTL